MTEIDVATRHALSMIKVPGIENMECLGAITLVVVKDSQGLITHMGTTVSDEGGLTNQQLLIAAYQHIVNTVREQSP